jgi:hypothetical protein
MKVSTHKAVQLVRSEHQNRIHCVKIFISRVEEFSLNIIDQKQLVR